MCQAWRMENSDLFICIDHVGLAVPDLDEAIKFHSEVFGWRELHREVNEEQGVAEAMIGTGEQGEENAKIQLLAPLNENSTIAKFLDRSGPGIQQLAYRVADLDAVSATLRERGMRPGLWIEPEVVGVRSPMASALPDEAFMTRRGARITEHDRYLLDLRSEAARAHLDAVFDRIGPEPQGGAARIFAAGMTEWRRSHRKDGGLIAGTQAREYAPLTLESPKPGRRIAVALEE